MKINIHVYFNFKFPEDDTEMSKHVGVNII